MNTTITDSDLLCEAGDIIDNAVFDYISTTLRKQPAADAFYRVEHGPHRRYDGHPRKCNGRGRFTDLPSVRGRR